MNGDGVRRLTGSRYGGDGSVRARHLALLVAGLWLVTVAGLALVASRSYAAYLTALLRSYPQRGHSLVFVPATVAVATLLAMGAGLLRPDWWRRAALALALLPAPVLLVTSHNIAAGCAAIALFGPVLWLGREVAARLLRLSDPLEAWIIGGACGLGLLAALGAVLGSLGALRAPLIWLPLLVGLLVLFKVARHRLRRDLVGCARWLARPVVRRPQHFALAGVLLGYLWLNLIGALAPEMYADAVVSRIPTAALFARTGRFTVDPDLAPSIKPGLGEVLYAVALTVGPLQTAKIVNLLVMLLCAAGVWALGRRLGGRRAGDIAVLAFYTLPLTTLLSQIAYLDAFATLFGVMAALMLVLRERLAWRDMAATLAFIGLGLVTKLSFGPTAAGLAVALALLAAWERRGVARTSAPAVKVGVFLLASLAVLSAAALLFVIGAGMELPGPGAPSPLVSALQPLARALQPRSILFKGVDVFGSDRSLVALVRSPLEITLHSSRHSEYLDGFLGFLLLALVPLVLVTRPGRRLVIVLVAAAVAYLLWFRIAQYLRYGLPLFAIFCAVGGAAYVATARRGAAAIRGGMGLVLLLLAGLGVLGYLNTELTYPGEFPYRVVLGVQSKEAYLAEQVPGYAAIRLLDAQPGATRAFVTHDDPARLYTRVRLTSLYHGLTSYYRTEGELLQYLDQEQFSHIVVNRGQLPPNWDEFLVLNEEFLRRNTMLVGGGRNVYVYRILPPDQRGHDQPWAQGAELLPDGDFEGTPGAAPPPWRPFGRPTLDRSFRESRNGRGAVRATQDDGYTIDVKVEPAVRYLLSQATRGANGYGSARLRIAWLDAAGHPLGAAEEVVPVSPRGYYPHSLLATAPPGAATARIYVWARQGEVWFDDCSLRSVPPDR